jgi:hypothetical protein
MLYQNDYVQREMARQHQDRLLKEASAARFREGSEGARLRYRERLILGIAELLILSGKKLKGRYQPWHWEILHEPALPNREGQSGL